jgi:hypothetical protein
MRNPPRRHRHLGKSPPEFTFVPEGRWVYMSTPRTYWTAPYGGAVGQLLAVLVIVACLVLWLTNQLDPKLAALIGVTALARLL